jgi:hypothetical protein
MIIPSVPHDGLLVGKPHERANCMRSLLVWMSLLVFLGSGNIPLTVFLLLLALFLPGRLGRSGPKMPRSRHHSWMPWKPHEQKSAVALHHDQNLDVSHSRRFNQILYSNLQFLEPLSEDKAKLLLDEAARAAIAGQVGVSLARFITEILPDATEDDIDVISETAIRKVQAALLQTRAERMECQWYIWRTCQDGRVRPAHARLEGVICSFQDPPHPELLAGETDLGAYNPGESRECRCYAETIIDPDFESWPRLIILNGQQWKIDLKEFKALSQAESPVHAG